MKTDLALHRLDHASLRLVAISATEARMLKLKLHRAAVCLIPLAIELSTFATSAPGSYDGPTGISVILIVAKLGSSRTEDPIFDLIETFTQRRLFRESIMLRVVGATPSPELKWRAANAEAVDVVGDPIDIGPEYAKATVVIVPATQVSGVKTTVLQAWASKRPLVVTPQSAEGLPVEDGCNALLRTGSGAILDAAITLTLDPAYRHSLAAEGWKAVQQYDLRPVSERALDVLLP